MLETIEPWVLPTLQVVAGAAVLIALIAVGYWLAARGLGMLVVRKRLSEAMAFSLRRLLRWTAIVVGAVVLLEWFGILINAWALLSTVLALVAIGFVAVWSILSNVLCSLLLLLARPFRVGDTVELPSQGLGGKVVDFTLLFTIMQDESGDLIQIPNNMFFQTPVRRRLGEATRGLDEQLRRDTPDLR